MAPAAPSCLVSTSAMWVLCKKRLNARLVFGVHALTCLLRWQVTNVLRDIEAQIAEAEARYLEDTASGTPGVGGIITGWDNYLDRCVSVLAVLTVAVAVGTAVANLCHRS